MNKNFVKLYESWMQRYTLGGFLAGDEVVFKDNALKDPWFKDKGVNTVDKVKSMMESGLNIRVSAVKPYRPAVSGAGNTDYNNGETVLDITSEIAPGRYKDFVTIPSHLVVPKSSYPNLPSVPEVFKKDDPSRRVNIKPKAVKDEAEEAPFYSPAQTKLSDLGNKKLSKGDRDLLNTNVKIPSSPAVGQSDPASYTAKYLP